jgi:hypothetical protein
VQAGHAASAAIRARRLASGRDSVLGFLGQGRTLLRRVAYSDEKSCDRNREGFRVGDRSWGRYATPADFPLHDCSPYSHVHVRRESVGFVHHSRTILCRTLPNPNDTIRNFCIAVWTRRRSWTWARRWAARWAASSSAGTCSSTSTAPSSVALQPVLSWACLRRHPRPTPMMRRISA